MPSQTSFIDPIGPIGQITEPEGKTSSSTSLFCAYTQPTCQYAATRPEFTCPTRPTDHSKYPKRNILLPRYSSSGSVAFGPSSQRMVVSLLCASFSCCTDPKRTANFVIHDGPDDSTSTQWPRTRGDYTIHSLIFVKGTDFIPRPSHGHDIKTSKAQTLQLPRLPLTSYLSLDFELRTCECPIEVHTAKFDHSKSPARSPPG